MGLGVAISDFDEVIITSLTESSQPSAVSPTIFVPITISARFRVEPEVGFGWSTTETTGTSSTTTSKSVVHIGSGAFGVTLKDRFAVYYGAPHGAPRNRMALLKG